MGWLNKKQRRKVLKTFGVVAYYMCDYCKKPIKMGESPVYNPRKGFHILDLGSQVSSYFVREPKVTYHSNDCNDRALGKKIRRVPKLSRKQRRIVDKVYTTICIKHYVGYWTKKRLFKRLHKYPQRRILRALKYLKLARQIYRTKRGYVPV